MHMLFFPFMLSVITTLQAYTQLPFLRKQACVFVDPTPEETNFVHHIPRRLILQTMMDMDK